MRKTFYIAFAFSIFLCGVTFAQTKFEKEYGIKSAEVPEIALRFIDSLGFNSKINWYKEEGLNTTTIEAKTKYNRKKYSIEFSSDGVLEDVEIEIKWKKVPSKPKTKISDYLKSTYGKYKVEKVQLQYSGSQAAIKAKLRNEPHNVMPVIRYEIILVTRSDKTFKKFEYLFSEAGEFLEMSEVILRNPDNLIH